MPTVKRATRLALVGSLPILLLACGEEPEPLTETVTISTGTLEGMRTEGGEALVFKGIPFAAPPVDDLRWRPPQPVAPWEGVREAKSFSPACFQPPSPVESFYGPGPENKEEDCLYLNVWTGARSAAERRPVLVWIHGGALMTGTGANEIYDGLALTRKGAVVVTLNYRLGPLGFLAHPALSAENDPPSSGAWGILDQIAALDWVQKNISAFGGDPNNVTIFGESAGSWSVCYLSATPLAAGLFHRAIGQSGAVFEPMMSLSEAEKHGEEFASRLDVGEEVAADLRSRSAEELYEAIDPDSPTLWLRPSVDGHLFPTDIHTLYAEGRQNDVPLLVGYNSDEHTVFGEFVPAPESVEEYEETLREMWGDSAEDFLAVYPASDPEEARVALLENWADQLFAWQMRTWARLASRTGTHPVFLYHFNRVPPGPRAEEYGSYHAAEIAYVFNNLGKEAVRSTLEIEPEKLDFDLAEVMSTYWMSFALTGNPNFQGLPPWPPYEEETDRALLLGSEIEPVSGLEAERLDVFDRHYESMRNSHE